MLEEIIDAVEFHQPAHEGKIGLAILYAIVDLVVIAGGAVAEIVEAGLGEDLLDDVAGVLVEENPAIGPISEQIKPRPQSQPVAIIVLGLADPLRVGEDAVEDTLLALIGVDLEGAALAERLVEIDVLFLA